MARKEKLPVQAVTAEISADIPADDLDVPAYLRRPKSETK
jgi:hypothetical protein